MTNHPTAEPRPHNREPFVDSRQSDPLGCLPEVSRLSVLSYLDPTSRRPREGVWVCGTAFKVQEGKVSLGGGSLLFDPPSETDAVHLTEFLQRVLDSKR